MSDDPQTDRQNDHSYSVNELADEAGVTRRTVHYYIAQGLLPASGTEGRGTKYGQAHLDRLRLIRELQRAHLPLAEIRQRITRLNDVQIADLIARDDLQPAQRGSAFEYIQSVLDGTNPRALASMVRQPSPTSPNAALAYEVPPSSRRAPFSAPTVTAGHAFAFVAPLATPSEIAEGASARAPSPPVAAKPGAVAPRPAPAYWTADPAAAAAPAKSTAPPQINPAETEPSRLTRSQWDRIPLAPDVELHVRRPLSRYQNRAVDRLVGLARKLLEEDPS